MARRDVKLIGSLVDYVQDIKPYHTKLREFASELIFNDAFNVSVIDDHHMQIYMQNIWTRDDLGCHSLSIISEGTEADRFFKIPATIWPHFSFDDQTANDVEGAPLSDDPWLTSANTSHFPASDWVPVPAVVTGYDILLKGPVEKNHGTGPNLVLNGTFDNNADMWYPEQGAILNTDNGYLHIKNDVQGSHGYAVYTLRTEVGKTYIFTIAPIGGTGTGIYHILNEDNFNDHYILNSTNTEEIFTARGEMTSIRLHVGGNTRHHYYEWDNVSLREYDPSKLTYHFRYDLEIAVDGSIEDAYGLGNSFQVYINDQDVTYKASRADVVGAFDTSLYEDELYDSMTRTFAIRGISGSFTPDDKDFELFPKLELQQNSWVAQYAYAKYRPKIEIFYTNTGRYNVPFHQGTRVYVDGNLSVFGSSYTVESSRNFIQFMRGRHPHSNQTISVNTMTVDRLFISETHPFSVNPQTNINENWAPFTGAGYDEVIFEDLPFDMGLPNVLCDYFTFKIDDVYPGRASPVSFMNSTNQANKSTLTITDVNYTAQNGEIYLVCATGLWTFSVQQIAPYAGPISHGQFKQPFSNGKISFIVDKTWTPYYMVPDNNTYSSYSHVYDIYSFSQIDPTDQLMNLSLVTEHGVIDDPDETSDKIHKPVEFVNIGKVRRVDDSTSMTRSWIGVETYDSFDNVGVIVYQIYPNGPADNSGIILGDIILSVENTTIRTTPDLLNEIRKYRPGETVEISILRGINTHSMMITINNQLAELEYYRFELNEVPQRGIYYEIRIEQTGGLNQRVHTRIDDDVVITVLEDGNEFLYHQVYSSRNPNNPDITVVDVDPIDSGDPSQYVDPEYWDRDYVD